MTKHLNIEITHKCNQNCFYCFNNSGMFSRTGEMSLANWLTILSIMQQGGLRSVHVTGGEPFVWHETINLLRKAQEMGLDISILSNGLHISSLAKSHADVFSRLTVAQISLDAMNSQLHDARRRRQGAWQEAIDAIETLQLLQVPVEISCVVSDGNLEELKAVGSYAKSIGAKLIARPLVTTGRASSTKLSSLFSKRLKQILNELNADKIDVVQDRFHYVPVTDDIDFKNSQRGILTIEPDGKFRGSHFLISGKLPVTNALELLEAA